MTCFIVTNTYMDSDLLITFNECSTQTQLTLKTMKNWKITNFYEF